MDGFIDILKGIQSVVWGPITLILLVGTGLYFTIRLGFLQITKLPRAIRYIFEKEKGVEGDDGDVSAFASLCTTLAATIGTGSIVGVATALEPEDRVHFLDVGVCLCGNDDQVCGRCACSKI